MTLIDDVTIAQARDRLLDIVAADSARDAVMRALAPSGAHILEESWLPLPGGDTSSFLSLHFDQGHPLFPSQPADLCLYVALYLPAGSPSAAAATRVAGLDALCASREWGTAGEVEERLSRYAQSHGSSWDWDGDSGHRVSCFARVLDALSAPHRLTNFRATPKERWYDASAGGHEFKSLEEEQAFYAACGVGLEAIEERIVLRPGQLLVVDNVRAVHGRAGRRAPGEVYQFVVGSRRVPAENAHLLRSGLVESLSRRTPA